MGLPKLARESFSKLLRERDITPTHQRVEIAQALLPREQHLAADEILALVNRQHTETSKATVYNTLRLFVEKGLIREVIVDPTQVFYDSNTEPHRHLFDACLSGVTHHAAMGSGCRHGNSPTPVAA